MKIKTELLKAYIADIINERIDDFEIDADKIADTVAIKMLEEIYEIIKDDSISDFDAIERIIEIFEENKIDYGVRHNVS